MKRSLSIILVLTLLMALGIPALAVDNPAFSVKVVGTIDTVKFSGDDVLLLDWQIMANDAGLSLYNGQGLRLAYDKTVLKLITWDASEAVVDGFGFPPFAWGTALTVIDGVGSEDGVYPQNVMLYAAQDASGNIGYLNFNLGHPTRNYNCPQGTYVSLMKVRFAFQDGKSAADLKANSVRYMTVDELYSLNQSNAVILTTTEDYPAGTTYKYLDQVAGTLTGLDKLNAPEIILPVVVDPGVAPTIPTASLPNGTYNVPYSAALAADGDEPITWSATGLPANGLSISAAGVISGTPTAAGPINITVTAINAAGSDSKSFTIVIAKASQAAFSITGPASKYTTDANFTPTTSGGSGAGAVTFNYVSGPATIVANQVQLTGAAGTVVITATKSGGANYDDITSAPFSIAVSVQVETPFGIVAANRTSATPVTAMASNWNPNTADLPNPNPNEVNLHTQAGPNLYGYGPAAAIDTLVGTGGGPDGTRSRWGTRGWGATAAAETYEDYEWFDLSLPSYYEVSSMKVLWALGYPEFFKIQYQTITGAWKDVTVTSNTDYDGVDLGTSIWNLGDVDEFIDVNWPMAKATNHYFDSTQFTVKNGDVVINGMAGSNGGVTTAWGNPGRQQNHGNMTTATANAITQKVGFAPVVTNKLRIQMLKRGVVGVSQGGTQGLALGEGYGIWDLEYYGVDAPPPPPGPADLNALQAALARFAGLTAGDWTAASWAVADAANTAALDYNNPSLTELDQDDIDAATAALNAAIDALAAYVPPVDKDALAAALADFATLTASDWTAGSWAVAAAEAVLAQGVYDNGDATQGEVDNATADLLAAIEALVAYVAPVDKDALAAALADFALLDEDDWTAGSWAAAAAEAVLAQAVYDNTAATQGEVDDATADLLAAIGALVEKPPVVIVDKDALAAALADFAALTASDWTADSWAAAAAEAVLAQAVYDNDDATQAEVDGATADLLAAIEALSPYVVVPVDKDALWAALEDFMALDDEDWTAASWAVAFAAAEAALDVYVDDDATQGDVDAATSALLAAIAALKPVPTGDPYISLPPTQAMSIKLAVGASVKLDIDTNLDDLVYSCATTYIIVSADGVVTGIKGGMAVITVSSLSNPSLKVNIVVTVS